MDFKEMYQDAFDEVAEDMGVGDPDAYDQLSPAQRKLMLEEVDDRYSGKISKLIDDHEEN